MEKRKKKEKLITKNTTLKGKYILLAIINATIVTLAMGALTTFLTAKPLAAVMLITSTASIAIVEHYGLKKKKKSFQKELAKLPKEDILKLQEDSKQKISYESDKQSAMRNNFLILSGEKKHNSIVRDSAIKKAIIGMASMLPTAIMMSIFNIHLIGAYAISIAISLTFDAIATKIWNKKLVNSEKNVYDLLSYSVDKHLKKIDEKRTENIEKLPLKNKQSNQQKQVVEFTSNIKNLQLKEQKKPTNIKKEKQKFDRKMLIQTFISGFLISITLTFFSTFTPIAMMVSICSIIQFGLSMRSENLQIKQGRKEASLQLAKMDNKKMYALQKHALLTNKNDSPELKKANYILQMINKTHGEYKTEKIKNIKDDSKKNILLQFAVILPVSLLMTSATFISSPLIAFTVSFAIVGVIIKTIQPKFNRTFFKDNPDFLSEEIRNYDPNKHFALLVESRGRKNNKEQKTFPKTTTRKPMTHNDNKPHKQHNQLTYKHKINPLYVKMNKDNNEGYMKDKKIISKIKDLSPRDRFLAVSKITENYQNNARIYNAAYLDRSKVTNTEKRQELNNQRILEPKLTQYRNNSEFRDVNSVVEYFHKISLRQTENKKHKNNFELYQAFLREQGNLLNEISNEVQENKIDDLEKSKGLIVIIKEKISSAINWISNKIKPQKKDNNAVIIESFKKLDLQGKLNKFSTLMGQHIENDKTLDKKYNTQTAILLKQMSELITLDIISTNTKPKDITGFKNKKHLLDRGNEELEQHLQNTSKQYNNKYLDIFAKLDSKSQSLILNQIIKHHIKGESIEPYQSANDKKIIEIINKMVKQFDSTSLLKENTNFKESNNKRQSMILDMTEILREKVLSQEKVKNNAELMQDKKSSTHFKSNSIGTNNPELISEIKSKIGKQNMPIKFQKDTATSDHDLLKELNEMEEKTKPVKQNMPIKFQKDTATSDHDLLKELNEMEEKTKPVKPTPFKRTNFTAVTPEEKLQNKHNAQQNKPNPIPKTPRAKDIKRPSEIYEERQNVKHPDNQEFSDNKRGNDIKKDVNPNIPTDLSSITVEQSKNDRTRG